MPLITMKELFPTPWGILDSRRIEVEASPSGGFKRIYEEEMTRRFISAREIAGKADFSISTAYRLMASAEAKFIVQEGVRLYLSEDAEKAIALWSETEADRKAKKSAKMKGK